jgi:hypothetical protein
MSNAIDHVFFCRGLELSFLRRYRSQKKEPILNAKTDFEEDEEYFWRLPEDRLLEVTENLRARCKSAGIDFVIKPNDDGDPDFNFAFSAGPEKRNVSIWDQNDLVALQGINFEQFTFISNLQAICNYEKGTIEAAVQAAGNSRPLPVVYKRLFGMSIRDARKNSAKISVESEDGQPYVELGMSTAEYDALVSQSASTITMKVSDLKIRHHDEALECLTVIANSLLFQLDMISDLPLVLKRVINHRRGAPAPDDVPVLTFPKVEFDSAPLSLYWYGRSATGMPLLQYLAFYQVIEFYFPRYSQSEAHRKLKSVLKDPTFRSEKDSDVAKLLAAIHVSKNGAFGDERSQLRAVLDECTFSEDLKKFIASDKYRSSFFHVKTKTPYHKVNVLSDDDIRADVSRRIYEIRCKIVHTKSDSRDVEVKMLLPFSSEADQLRFDIELIQYVAQKVLIAGATNMR